MADQRSNDYKTELQGIRAPLGVILYLIRRDNLDIYDIPIAKITSEYLEYLDLMEEFKVMYSNFKEIINSTAAARINGYLAGYGTCETLKSELESYGLSSKGMKKISDLVCGQRTIVPCIASKYMSILS